MLFKDMRCVACGNAPEMAEVPQGQEFEFTAFYNKDLTIYFCRSCLEGAGRAGRVIRSITEHRPPNVYEYIWNPDGPDESYRLPAPRLLSRSQAGEIRSKS